jgi:hypothetical protein
MFAEELDEEAHPLLDENTFSLGVGSDISLAVGEVVLSFVPGPARTAVGVPLPERSAAPCELCGRLMLSTATATHRQYLVPFR